MWLIIEQTDKFQIFTTILYSQGAIKSKSLSNNTFALSPNYPTLSNPSTMRHATYMDVPNVKRINNQLNAYWKFKQVVANNRVII